jgi:hypothetical protein
MLWLVALLAILIYLYEQGASQGDSGAAAVGAGWSSVMANTMAKFENANPAYNNPLAIQGTGDTGSTAPNGLGIFSTAEAGMAAGIALLESYAARFPGLTIKQILARWTTGDADNDSDSINNEAGMVGDALGVDPNTTTMSDLTGSVDDTDS